jgi:hypothetical protein
LSPQDLIQLVAEGVARAQLYGAPQGRTATSAPKVSRLKMENPETFDGKPTTPFNDWWKSVTKYLSFYPETTDQQKIAWVGTLLSGTAKSWDLHRYDTLGENDTWANYAADIKKEYHDSREAANAQRKLGQLKYEGDIRAYMTEFRALNSYARATGEGLQEKVDLAMPNAVLDMRFAHYLEDFVDDEGFLDATYRAALQVEKKKALQATKEAAREAPASAIKTGRKDTRRADPPRQEEKRRTSDKEKAGPTKRKEKWASFDAALRGVPQKEVDDHKKERDSCWRCGRPGHRTWDCYAATTLAGTALPQAPWKVAAVSPVVAKRPREDEPEETPPAKLQKVAAVEAMETDWPIWESEESDF